MRPWVNKAAKTAKEYLGPRWRRWALVLIPLALVVVTLSGSGVYRACINEPPQHNADKAEAENTATIPSIVLDFAWRRWKCSGDFVEKYHEDIIALFTILLVWVTGTLWWATEKLVKGADDNAQRQLRAYIQVQLGGNNNIDLGTGAKPEVIIKIRNSGQTPAREVWVRCAVDVLTYPEPKDLPIPELDEIDTSLCIHAGSDVGDYRQWIKRGLRAEEASAIAGGGSKRLFLYGMVEYRDVFGKDWVTRFRFRTTGPDDNPQGGIGIVPAKYGNSAT
jgi:hypothetical protein